MPAWAKLPIVRGLLSLAVALIAMHGVVICVLAAATRRLAWAAAAAVCLAIAAHACSQLYSWLFARR